jgi:hypothetical protein
MTREPRFGFFESTLRFFSTVATDDFNNVSPPFPELVLLLVFFAKRIVHLLPDFLGRILSQFLPPLIEM